MPPCKITLLQVCSQLLAYPGEELQVHFFAAQTLRRKTQRQLAALNDYQRQELGNSLVTYINQHSAEQMTAVVIQLCLALASLIVQAEIWTDVLKTLSEPPKQSLHSFSLHLLSRRQVCAAGQQLSPRSFLQLLTVLPEEPGDAVYRRLRSPDLASEWQANQIDRVCHCSFVPGCVLSAG